MLSVRAGAREGERGRSIAEVSESDSTEFSASSRLVRYSLEKAREQCLRSKS